MSISSQRIIIILIALNFLIGFGFAIYTSIETTNTETLERELGFLENIEEDVATEEGIWGSVKSIGSRLSDSTIGNGIKMGYKIIVILFKGLNPFSIRASMFDNNFEKSVAWVILFFRSVLITVSVLEGYLIFKNNKTN